MTDVVESNPDRPPLSSGQWTVAAMIAFGVVMVFGMWLYWEFYTRPFRQLQLAIEQQYPGSSPRAIGGQHKSHDPNSPKVLRIIVRIPTTEFHPELDQQKSEQRASEIASLIDQHHDIDQYEQLEIHLMQQVPEHETRHWSLVQPVSQWVSQIHSPHPSPQSSD